MGGSHRHLFVDGDDDDEEENEEQEDVYMYPTYMNLDVQAHYRAAYVHPKLVN